MTEQISKEMRDEVLHNRLKSRKATQGKVERLYNSHVRAAKRRKRDLGSEFLGGALHKINLMVN